MKQTTVQYYCDICGKRMDYSRFIKLEPKIRTLNMWGVRYDVCDDCFVAVGRFIKTRMNEVKTND